MPPEPIKEFTLAPLPKAIQNLTAKFPTLEKTFADVGITKMADISKLESISLTLPGLTKLAEQLALPHGVPITMLSSEAKRQLPSEIVFSRTGGGLIDMNAKVSLSNQGQLEQTIHTVSGAPLRLSVKVDQPAKSVKGYLVFTSRESSPSAIQLPLNSLLSSLIFSNPVFAQAQTMPINVENKLVLQQFDYTDPDGDGIYTADINSPAVDGTYDVITVITYIDPDLGTRAIHLTTVVDPEGYVYELVNGQQLRINGAVVALSWLDSVKNQYELWPATDYQQENPQTTDATGKYSFLVPPGTYALRIEAPGYVSYDGKPFTVAAGNSIHQNIELSSTHSWLQLVDWRTGLLVLIAVLFVFNFAMGLRRRKQVN